jgi:hypothetical protein
MPALQRSKAAPPVHENTQGKKGSVFPMINGTQFLDEIIPLFIAFAVTAMSGPFLIPFLIRIKAEQTERDDGPKSHLEKTGTPNMGGIMILAAVVAVGIIYSFRYPDDRTRAHPHRRFRHGRVRG